MRDGWIVVQTFINEVEAQEARAQLEARGLEALIESDNCGGMRPHFDYSVGVKVLVREQQLEQAQELLRAAFVPVPEGTWVCAGCGESVENQFGTCWQCGRDRD